MCRLSEDCLKGWPSWENQCTVGAFQEFQGEYWVVSTVFSLPFFLFD